MAMQFIVRELRKTGNPRDQSLADIISGVLKVRGEDIPLPQEGTQVLDLTTDVSQSEATFKEKFTSLWERRGFSQAELAKQVGDSPQTFNKRINGRLKMKREAILKAMDILGNVVPVDIKDANELLALAGYEGLAETV